MRQNLLILFLFVFHLINSQEFKLEDLQTDQQIEVALDSAFQWMEYTKQATFTKNYLVIDKALANSNNDEYKARFNAYKSGFYASLYDRSKSEYHLSLALDYYEKHKNIKMLVYVYNLKSIHASYIDLDPKTGAMWANKAIDLVPPDNEELQIHIIDVYFSLALNTLSIKDYEACFNASIKCIELATRLNKSRLPRMYYTKGMAELKLNRIDEAMHSFGVAEKLVTQKELATGEKTYYKNLSYLHGYSEVYEHLKNYKLASEYLKKYYSRVDDNVRYFSQSIGTRIQKHSELLVDLAKIKEQKAEEELRKSEIFYNLLVLGLALLIIGVLLTFILQQRKHEHLNLKKNSLLTSKNKELVAVKDQIEKTLKLKTDFLNSITHELRTPLYAINSITHMIKNNTKHNIDTSQIDILTFSGDHLLRFVNDVIDFNLGSANHEFKKLKIEKINLKKLLQKIEKTITFSIVMNHENKFIFDFDSKISRDYEIDSLKLSRIIINLLNNSAKYTQDGTISFFAKQIATTATTSTVEFCIKDNGIGISKTQLEEINVAFKNNLDLVKRINNKASGLGLGLVMVNRLLKIFNSTLHIESKEGVGTTMSFVIVFELDTTNNRFNSTVLSPPQNNKTKHILIVDDNKINQIVTAKIIKNQGNTCDIAKGGEEAITMFNKNHNYDFILMDIMMPGMDGFEATEIIKSIEPKQRIIALTAISLRENKQKFIDSGFEDVIEKPFKIEKFNMLID